MPLTAEHKQRSKQRILKSAVKLFTRHGYENTSIDDVMADAELTRGAFYAHFSSKSDLYKSAILDAALNSRLVRNKPEDITDRDWMTRIINGYLSKRHIENTDVPCPLAFLVTDVAVREPTVRKTYTKVFKSMHGLVANYVKSFSTCNEQRALAVAALMIGGVAIGRALNDKTTTESLLNSCKDAIELLLEKA